MTDLNPNDAVKEVDADGNITYKTNEMIGRGGDLPARISADGDTIEWWENGTKSRENGPALITIDPKSDAYMLWVRNGLFDRDYNEGPTSITPNKAHYTFGNDNGAMNYGIEGNITWTAFHQYMPIATIPAHVP